MPPGVVLLFGPTAVGKTDLLDALFTGRAEVVSADALQVYRGMDVGTAKPDWALRRRLPHHLIDIRHFSESFNVADFCRLADEAVKDILERGLIPVISGGTAYYLKAWLMGVPRTPPVDEELRARLAEKWQDKSNEELAAAAAEVDPLSAQRLGRGDRYRMLRVLEVYEQCGRALSDFAVPDTPRTDFRFLSLGLTREREQLYQRINRRVEAMMKGGLEEEVRSLIAQGACRESPGMKGIGYREWFEEDIDGKAALSREAAAAARAVPGKAAPPETVPPETAARIEAKAVPGKAVPPETAARIEAEAVPGKAVPPETAARIEAKIAQSTRRYAKRQMTFFRSLPDVLWFDAGRMDDMQRLEEAVEQFLL